jgi:shikimate dehydrogenase
VTAPPARLAVLGDPLTFSRSPELHRAGYAALGLAAESEAIRVQPARLGGVLHELALAGYRGVNLTHPLKQAALAHLGSVSDSAAASRSVNTVSFGPGGAHGDTTDGAGFLDLLRSLDLEPRGTRVAFLGAGGASRSLALALVGAGARAVTACARRPAQVAEAWSRIAGAEVIAWGSDPACEALALADVVVNGTPLSGPDGPCSLAHLPQDALVIDLVYGPEVTPWVFACRAAGRRAVDGLGLLVHQARHAIALWTGREVPLEPLARAVGWPR